MTMPKTLFTGPSSEQMKGIEASIRIEADYMEALYKAKEKKGRELTIEEAIKLYNRIKNNNQIEA